MGAPRTARTLWILGGSASALVLAAAHGGAAAAQEAASERDVIVVTGTRRSTDIQDVPVNIAAVGAGEIEQQNLGDLSDISKLVPGVFLVDQGTRDANQIVFRGLNADPVGAAEGIGNGNNGGGTVATYVGEIPVYIDLRLNDMDRVEFLIGPQGTLYGAGTLGGAIRYIPKRPDFDAATTSVRADAYAYSEADGVSLDRGATVNIPLADTLAVRASVDYLDDTGFIDQPFLVREIGVSNPNTVFAPPAVRNANLRREEDTNWEQTLSGRLGVRWKPIEAIDANLTYYYQDQDVGGRSISSWRSTVGAGKYENGKRVLEPNDRENQLAALEVIADLGFAELTSASGYSRYDQLGQRDQNDLLITLEYSYELFPAFTAFTREVEDVEIISQELRLVSKTPGPLSWILGGFFNQREGYATSSEFTPGFDQFAVDNLGGVALRPDSLEYYSVGDSLLIEQAVFGEIGYDITDRWNVTVGTRWYDYRRKTLSSVDFPLSYTVYNGDPPDLVFAGSPDLTTQSDDGFLFKFNTSYQVTDDILAYFTVSEGYRIGDSNGLEPCDEESGEVQSECALPFEEQYFPDKTVNYEIGARTTWLGGDLLLNGAAYYIDWTDPQVSSATVNASIPITINGEGAQSVGAELFFDYKVTDAFSLRGSYGYNHTELTEPVPNLIRTTPGSSPPVVPAGETCIDSDVPPNVYLPGEDAPSLFASCFADGEKGDRLPGYPEHMVSLFASYTIPLGAGDLDLSYGVSAISEVLTRTGGRGGGLTLDGYDRHNASASYSQDGWTLTAYVDNIFDSFDETGAIGSSRANQPVFDIDGGPVFVRSFATDVLPPRTYGLRLTVELGG